MNVMTNKDYRTAKDSKLKYIFLLLSYAPHAIVTWNSQKLHTVCTTDNYQFPKQRFVYQITPCR